MGYIAYVVLGLVVAAELDRWNGGIKNPGLCIALWPLVLLCVAFAKVDDWRFARQMRKEWAEDTARVLPEQPAPSIQEPEHG